MPRSLPHFLFFSLYNCCIPLGKCATHSSDNFVRSVVLHFCVNVHGNLAALMPSQVLNRLRVYRSMDQICDIGVTQLVRRYLKIQAVNHFSVMRRFLSEYRFHGMLYTHTIFISVIHPFLGCPGDNVLPKPLNQTLCADCSRYRFLSPFCMDQSFSNNKHPC